MALTESVSLDAFGRADWVSRVSGRMGPAEYKANLDGHTFGVMATWSFNGAP